MKHTPDREPDKVIGAVEWDMQWLYWALRNDDTANHNFEWQMVSYNEVGSSPLAPLGEAHWHTTMSKRVADEVEAVETAAEKLLSVRRDWLERPYLEDANKVIVDGKFYRIGDPVWAGHTYKGMLGFSGRVFTITWLDASRSPTKTNNLWYGGVIPKAARKFEGLKDNATLEWKEIQPWRTESKT